MTITKAKFKLEPCVFCGAPVFWLSANGLYCENPKCGYIVGFGAVEGSMNTKTFYCPETDRAFEINVDEVEWFDNIARIDCPAHDQPGRHFVTIARPVAVGFGGGDGQA